MDMQFAYIKFNKFHTLEETDRKDLMLRRKRVDGYMKGQEKIVKRNWLERHKTSKLSLEKNRYLEWTERRVDNGKICTTTKRMIGQL